MHSVTVCLSYLWQLVLSTSSPSCGHTAFGRIICWFYLLRRENILHLFIQMSFFSVILWVSISFIVPIPTTGSDWNNTEGFKKNKIDIYDCRGRGWYVATSHCIVLSKTAFLKFDALCYAYFMLRLSFLTACYAFWFTTFKPWFVYSNNIRVFLEQYLVKPSNHFLQGNSCDRTENSEIRIF